MSNNTQNPAPIKGSILETYVRQAGDQVKQLCAATKGSKTLQEMADAMRQSATDLVEERLKKEKKSKFKGHYDYDGTLINVKRPCTYTWENYRCPRKTEEMTALDLKVELELEKRQIAIAKLQSAEEDAAVAQSKLKTARRNVRTADQTVAKLLPDSKCIHEGFTIDIL